MHLSTVACQPYQGWQQQLLHEHPVWLHPLAAKSTPQQQRAWRQQKNLL